LQIAQVDSRLLDYPIMVENTLNRFEARYGYRPKVYVKYAAFSSGKAWSTYIKVSLGYDAKDAQHVLLHELAHIAAGRNANHGPKFYATLKELIRYFKFDMQYAIMREGRYKPRNSKALSRRVRKV
jgi:predicted metal-dependent hydrolase